MKSTAADVDEYLDGYEGEWREALLQLRSTCQTILAEYDEVMAHGMPTYGRSGRIEVSFAKQAQYLSLYILKAAILDLHRAEFASLRVGKGCIRYRRVDQIDWNLIEQLLLDTTRIDLPPC